MASEGVDANPSRIIFIDQANFDQLNEKCQAVNIMDCHKMGYCKVEERMKEARHASAIRSKCFLLA